MRAAYEYGKRWNVKIPRYDIGWLIDRVHVGQADSEVASEIEGRFSWKEKSVMS
jgi:hypothetical protein